MKCEVLSGQIPGAPNAPDQRAEWLGQRLLLWALLSTIVAFSEGCATQPLRLQDWYSPPHVTPLPHLAAVAVHRFTDKRETAYTALGEEFIGREETGRNIKAGEPVTVTLRRAFADGLRARGFPVIESTGSDPSPESRSDVRLAVSGEIQEFWATRSHRAESNREAACTVRLQVSEVATGRMQWGKVYSRQYVWSPWMPERDRLDMGPALAKVLALTVEEAVYDPEFIRELRRR